MPDYTYKLLDKVHELRLKYLKQLENLDALERSLCRELEVEPRPPARDRLGRPIPWERRR